MNMGIHNFVENDFVSRKMNTKEYANLFGVTRNAAQKWLTGDINPSIATLMLMQLDSKNILNLKKKLEQKGIKSNKTLTGKRTGVIK
jgi:predicted transcriptional regulator